MRPTEVSIMNVSLFKPNIFSNEWTSNLDLKTDHLTILELTVLVHITDINNLLGGFELAINVEVII